MSGTHLIRWFGGDYLRLSDSLTNCVEASIKNKILLTPAVKLNAAGIVVRFPSLPAPLEVISRCIHQSRHMLNRRR